MHRVSDALSSPVLLRRVPASSGPAAAGGPTSALLSVPGAGQDRVALLHRSGVRRPGRPGRGHQRRGTGRSDESGRHATTTAGRASPITWLIHDVDPWRVDRVYPAAKAHLDRHADVGRPGAIWEGPVVWHQPENGARLMACSTSWAWAGRRGLRSTTSTASRAPPSRTRPRRRPPPRPLGRPPQPATAPGMARARRLGARRAGRRRPADARVDPTTAHRRAGGPRPGRSTGPAEVLAR